MLGVIAAETPIVNKPLIEAALERAGGPVNSGGTEHGAAPRESVRLRADCARASGDLTSDADRVERSRPAKSVDNRSRGLNFKIHLIND